MNREEPPRYTRYRARPRLLGGTRPTSPRPDSSGRGRRDRGRAVGSAGGWSHDASPLGALRKRLTPRRVLLGLLGLIVGWVALAVVLFLISAHFERVSPPKDVAATLQPAGFPLTSANNILVLGSDRRPKGSKEPGANISGPSRSDTIMLVRTGAGHAARLSIPRDTVVEIPGHGLQKINAAYAFGGPAESITVIEHWLGIKINHLVEVNFENFPKLIDAMGGVDYTGGCVISRINGGFRNGGYTLKLPAGTHHLDGKAALALARTRHNLCAPSQTDLQRAEHQQALFQDMKARLLSFSSFLRMPWIAWNAPPAIISDMSGPTLLGLFGALASSGTPRTRVLAPSGVVTLPDGESGLSVSEGERHAAVARFLAG